MNTHDPLHDIHHYSPTLTIAQVLKFCQRKEMDITRAMIQNYIRDGLLPSPAGRIYTQKHLAALALIDRLKTVFDISTIKKTLTPLMDGEGLPLEVYTQVIKSAQAAATQWEENVKPLLTRGGDIAPAAEMACIAMLKKI